MPSLFVSAAEKFGVELSLDVLPDDEVDGLAVEDEELGLVDDEDGLVVDEEDCATAAVDSAKSTAAVMMLRFLGIGEASNS